MSFSYIQKIPAPEEILKELPLPLELKAIKEQKVREMIAVFEGKSNKFLMIIGPCSADDENSVCEYVSKLAQLQDKVKDKIIIIPRIYTNKPRTTGQGYKGMAHQPDPEKEPNIVQGIKAIRKMHIRSLQESHLVAADEMLYPNNYSYLEDVLGYVAIGARSVENQQHRLTVSGLDIPVGMKNPTSGDLNVMLNSVQAGQAGHILSYNGWETSTSGNPWVHAILRGAINNYGQCIPNYHYEDMIRLTKLYEERSLVNPAIIIDTSHANSNKIFSQQPRIAMEIIRSRNKSDRLKTFVKGLMVESYLVEGSQDVFGKIYGKSITDPCLGWQDSEQLVLEVADNI